MTKSKFLNLSQFLDWKIGMLIQTLSLAVSLSLKISAELKEYLGDFVNNCIKVENSFFYKTQDLEIIKKSVCVVLLFF